jgi:hypothetical protein
MARKGVTGFSELLCVVDGRCEGHEDLYHRLVECQYELTDGLAYYLCGRRPGTQLLANKFLFRTPICA